MDLAMPAVIYAIDRTRCLAPRPFILGVFTCSDSGVLRVVPTEQAVRHLNSQEQRAVGRECTQHGGRPAAVEAVDAELRVDGAEGAAQ
ncbi:hypothetical protein ON010_g15914 [Phytophthora cinnamomi]|nr:hypothetical protein ON010_g15914 [Phytophthora cinnamomi]